MKQYEAAVQFLNLLREHPEHFTASLDSGRDHCTYTISNAYRAVSINIDTHSGKFVAVGATSGKAIMYVDEEVMEELYNWAIGYMAKAKIQNQVDKDNAAMYELIKFYEGK